MAFDPSAPALQLRSLLKDSGELELSLVEVPTPEPGPDEVLIRVEGAPLNPSDLGLLFAGIDMSSVRQSGTAARPVATASAAPVASLLSSPPARVIRGGARSVRLPLLKRLLPAAAFDSKLSKLFGLDALR